MGDHIDFSGSVFNEPFVGKSVTVQSSSIASVTLPRLDDKVYVVLVVTETTAEDEDHACYSTYVDVKGVAMSVEKANKYIRSLTFQDAVMTHEDISTDGTLYRHYDLTNSRDSTIAVYVDVVDVI